MRSRAARAARAALVALVVAACSASPPAPTDPRSTSPAASIPEPGRPFAADEILAAMRDSRRPGGVPDELESEQVAGQVADAIWTIDGEPWETMSIGGSCGPERCTLDVAGGRPNGMGDDAWTFSVRPGVEGSVSVTEHHLGAVPAELATVADDLARGSAIAGGLDGLVMASASWLPPPGDGVLVLAYRAGDEEGSCRRDVRVDLRSGKATVESAVDC